MAQPAIDQPRAAAGIVIIDELGQMELFSTAFIGSFSRLLDQAVPLVATVHARQHPVTDAIKQRSDIELREVRPGHADELLTYMISRLSPKLG